MTEADKEHVHNHIIWNSTALNCTQKFRNFWGSTKAVRRLNDTLCVENGLSIVENPKPHGKSYNKWLGSAAKPSHRELLRAVLDDALKQKPADFAALLVLAQKAGYEVKPGKVPALRGEGQKRFVRLDTLGDGYSESELCAVLAGTKAHKLRRKNMPPPTQKQPANLLIDIQAKLRDGKSAGYAQWAKVFNLKQMAQTLNFLTEHGLLEYTELAEKTALATDRYNELTAQIKRAESRMAEIAVLRTHIINYSKTREVYAAYRQAGYSKKYLAEHESDILIHKAAKKAFDELGIKKLPTVKTLQAEYAELLAAKKKAYAAYSSARQEMRELLTAKANVDRLMGYGEKRTEPKHDKSR